MLEPEFRDDLIPVGGIAQNPGRDASTARPGEQATVEGVDGIQASGELSAESRR